ncbi:MAG: hypothetical protein IID18_03355 [Nitrospinae bacterium]|nr:hypothetical protein [Nitrospinota bacterium]
METNEAGVANPDETQEEEEKEIELQENEPLITRKVFNYLLRWISIT